jgi:hypothetical protein
MRKNISHISLLSLSISLASMNPVNSYAQEGGTSGVYVIEKPSTASPGIQRLPMDAAAFVAPFRGGPIQTPVLVHSMEELSQGFGAPTGPLRSSAEDSGYIQVSQFFAHGGRSAWIVRSSDSIPTSKDIEALSSVPDQVGVLTLPALPYFPEGAAHPAWVAAARFAESNHVLLIADPANSAQTPAAVENGAMDCPN